MTDVKATPERSGGAGDTVEITVDGRTLQARPGELLIAAAERGGVYIPRFCWHSRMDPVGACRMCLVDVEGSPPIPGTSQRRPQTSCTTVVREGMVVHTQFTSSEINEAQKMILELLLINHPLDCPICDRGGECPLQDQAQDYGRAESKFIEPKRRYRKPVAISPLVNLDRERCILCYRCTRFCEELSGDALIGVMDRGPESFIFPFYSFDRGGETAPPRTPPNGDDVRGPGADDINQGFDSYFSGNTVQICPVGALTSSEYRFMARPWDLQIVPSTCNLCASGCSIDVGVRVQDGNVARFSAGTNEDTNEEWLCDKGRYGHAYISAPERLTQPQARRNGRLEDVTWDEAFRVLRDGLRPVIEGGRGAGLILGESLCDEDYYTAQKFARCVLQTNNVDHRIEGGMSADTLLPPQLTYDMVLGSDLVVLVSLDAREELPILFLRLRIAATKRGLPIAIVHPREVALSEFAALRLQPLPGDEAASAADASLADALRKAERPVILLGPRVAADASAIAAWFALATETNARMTWVPRRANSYGALAAGAHPELLPGWRRVTDDAARGQFADSWGPDVSEQPGLDVAGMLRAAVSRDLEALWLVGADVLNDIPDAGLGAEACSAAQFVVVQDVQRSPLLEHADLVFPAAAFVERDGTVTDWEGRRQLVNSATDPPGAARADYAILAESARRLHASIGCRTAADAGAELQPFLESAAVWPQVTAAGGNGARAANVGLRLLTYRLLYDDGSRIRRTRGIRELTPPAVAEINHADAQALGIADGDQVKVSSAHGSVTLRAELSKRVREGAIFVPWSQWGTSAQALCAWGDMTPDVGVERA